MAVQHATDATFHSMVLEASTPVVVDFWAPWCGPCRMVAPILEEIAEEHAGEFAVVKLNTDDNPATAAAYHITGIPTLNVYRNGSVVGSIVGARPKKALVKEITKILAR